MGEHPPPGRPEPRASRHEPPPRNDGSPDTHPTTEKPRNAPVRPPEEARGSTAPPPPTPPSTPPGRPPGLDHRTADRARHRHPGLRGGNTRADGPGRDSAPAPEPGTGSDAGSTGPAIAADAPPVPARATSGQVFRGQFDDGVRLALRRSRADSAVRRRALRAADGLVTILICGRRRRRVVLLAGLPFARFPVP